MMAAALPFLVGGSRLSRIVRRGALLLGAGAALLRLFSGERAGGRTDAAAAPEEERTGEKNPGSGRD